MISKSAINATFPLLAQAHVVALMVPHLWFPQDEFSLRSTRISSAICHLLLSTPNRLLKRFARILQPSLDPSEAAKRLYVAERAGACFLDLWRRESPDHAGLKQLRLASPPDGRPAVHLPQRPQSSLPASGREAVIARAVRPAACAPAPRAPHLGGHV